MMLQSCRHPYGQKKVMTKPINIKNDLVAAGLEEINEYGVRAFSLRRVAARCRVSCAAPYKHFESKEKLIYEIFATINRQWQEKQKKIIEKGLNLKDTLIERCMGHIAFLIQNPGFANLIMLNDQSLAKELRSIKTQLSRTTCELVDRYCETVHMPYEVKRRKLFTIRSVIYGAVIFMSQNTEIQYTKQHLDLVKSVIEREFVIN